jgi:Flp pilus assembly protein TadG
MTIGPAGTPGRRSIQREDGQALLLMVFALVVLLGLAALVFDFGRAYLAQRQLQQAVDAAALVAGQTMPDTQAAYAAAVDYSATGKNQHLLSMTAGAPTIKFKCVQSLAANNVPCLKDPTPVGGGSPSTPCSVDEPITKKCNAVQVTQSATVPTTFGRLFVPSLKVTARSTVGMRGGAPHPLNIMIVLDRTGSMGDPGFDSSPGVPSSTTACGDAVKDPGGNTVIPANRSTKIDCAKAGVRELLSGLLPCQPNLQVCGAAAPLDQVGMMVFPALNARNATTHDNTGNAAHSNINLDSSASCSGALTSNPSWYTPNRGFPNWFLQTSDIGYGSPAVAAVPAVDEVDRLDVQGNPANNTNPNPSFFTVRVNGQTTADITWPTTGATIQGAIEALSNVDPGDVTVSPANNNDPWTITFANGLGGQNVAFVVTNQLTGGGIQNTQVLVGAAGSPGSPAVVPDYSFAPLSNDFRTTPDPGLNANSRLTQAITWSSCPGGTTTVGTRRIASETSTGYPGNRYYGVTSAGSTYYTGALLAAQDALAAEAAAHPQRDAQPVIIFLTDGQANTGAANPCATAMSAAQAAAQAGTWVYSIAYNVSVNTSNADTYCQYPQGTRETAPGYPGGLPAYHTLAQIARDSSSPTQSDPTKFFCVGTPSSSAEPCQDGDTLTEVFKSIGTQLTASRIYSDDTFN